MDDINFGAFSDRGGSHSSQPHRNAPPVKNKRKKKRSFGKRLFIFFLIVALVCAGGYAALLNVMGKINYDDGAQRNVYVDADELKSDARVMNFLLIGIDDDAEGSSRSDSMLLFSIDRNNGKIKMTSFLRDMWVDIPGSGYAKMNAAYSYGGAQLVIDTIEYNFNIKIDNYILADFEMFTEIVDLLGGVDVEVKEAESKFLKSHCHLNVGYGEGIHLDGKQALVYCRIRYLDSDFMRTYRQRKVMTAIIDKVSDQNLFKLLSILNKMLPKLTTNISPAELTRLSLGAMKYIKYEIETERIPADNTWEDATRKGQAVLLADMSENREILNDFLYGNGQEEENG